ncbi:MAG: hypothetical protein ABL898_07730 [Hyphomicrobiaceae bacterium]
MILLILFISAIPTIISLTEFVTTRRAATPIEFYSLMIPAISFLGISSSLVTLADHLEFRARPTHESQTDQFNDLGALPLIILLMYILLAAEFIIYYMFSSYQSLSTGPEALAADLTPAYQRLERLADEKASKMYDAFSDAIDDLKSATRTTKDAVEKIKTYNEAAETMKRMLAITNYLTASIAMLYIVHQLTIWNLRTSKETIHGQ